MRPQSEQAWLPTRLLSDVAELSEDGLMGSTAEMASVSASDFWVKVSRTSDGRS